MKKVLTVFSISVVFMLLSITSVFAAQVPSVNRLAGVDRYETAFKIAEAGWKQSDYAILAYGENYPDALAAAPLAKKLNSPILLTGKDSLNSYTSTALADLKVKTIYIVGGTGVVSTDVEKQLTDLGYSVTRLAGKDRYETAIKIAEQLGTISEVAVTTGDDYADALSIASIAAQKQMPIILVPKDAVTDSIQCYLNSHKINNTYIVGDQSIISDNVASKFYGVERILGIDKYSRNINVLNRFSGLYKDQEFYLATGEGFADALTGTAFAASNSGTVVLVNIVLPEVTRDFLQKSLAAANKITVFGGEGVVPSFLVQLIQNDAKTADEALESLKSEAKTIPYKDLARNPDTYMNTKVKYTGEVIQVLEDKNTVKLRVNVTENTYGYEDTVFVAYQKNVISSRVLEKDIITFYGTSAGLLTYKSVLGASVTIPQIRAQIIEIN